MNKNKLAEISNKKFDFELWGDRSLSFENVLRPIVKAKHASSSIMNKFEGNVSIVRKFIKENNCNKDIENSVSFLFPNLIYHFYVIYTQFLHPSLLKGLLNQFHLIQIFNKFLD